MTPGWAIVNAIARWVIGRPASAGEGMELLDHVEPALVAEVPEQACAAQVVLLPLRTRPVSRPWPSGPQTRLPMP